MNASTYFAAITTAEGTSETMYFVGIGSTAEAATENLIRETLCTSSLPSHCAPIQVRQITERLHEHFENIAGTDLPMPEMTESNSGILDLVEPAGLTFLHG